MDDSLHGIRSPSAPRFTRPVLLLAGWIALITSGVDAAPVRAQQQMLGFRIIAARDTSFTAGAGAYRIRMVTDEPVLVRVSLDDREMTRSREVFVESVTDVAEFNWNGLDASGEPMVGSVSVMFDVEAADGTTKVLALPLTIEATGGDTVPLPGMPADTAQVWKESSTIPSLASLAAGLITGAAAIALPSAVALDGRGAPIRFAIGGTLGVTGVLGFFAQRERQMDPEAVERNRLKKEAWRAAVDATIEENRSKRRGQLHVIAGEVVAEVQR